MKRTLLMTGAIWAVGMGAWAVPIPEPLDKAVREADIVVVGTLGKVAPTGPTRKGITPAAGAIGVEQVLKGPPDLKRVTVKTTVEQLYGPIRYREGDSGVWILRREGNTYRGGNPTARQPMEKLADVKAAIAATGKAGSTTNPADHAEAINAFCLDLFGKLRETEKDRNIFFSPYSVSSAMAMCRAGAKGNTGTELDRALHFAAKENALHLGFRELSAAVQRTTDVKLRMANGLCLTQHGGMVRETYKNLLVRVYDAEIFSGGLDPVNAWVKRKTEGKIAKILEQLSPDSVCVILNAIYFKGDWLAQFDKQATRDAPFRILERDIVRTGTHSGKDGTKTPLSGPGPTKYVTVPMMHRTGTIQYLKAADFESVELPYKGADFSMIVLLPRKPADLARVEQLLTGKLPDGWLASVLARARSREVDLYLPRFKMETAYDLVSPLQKLGVNEAFLPGKAHFSVLVGGAKGTIWIAQVVHKAFVDVNEEGTEAAAATGVEMATESVKPSPIVFRADHPFLFLIRHNASGTILFMGRVANPKKGGQVRQD